MVFSSLPSALCTLHSGIIVGMFSERFIDTGEVRVRLLSGPDDGPPVLFLHGVSRVARDFAPLFPALLG